MSKQAPIRATSKTEAEDMARCDDRYRSCQNEYFWMCEVVEYLEGVTKIYKNRGYNLSAIKDLYLNDPMKKIYSRDNEKS